MSFAKDVLRSALEAVAEIEARVLLTVGRKFDGFQLRHVPRVVVVATVVFVVCWVRTYVQLRGEQTHVDDAGG
jgi:hypothetical protein